MIRSIGAANRLKMIAEHIKFSESTVKSVGNIDFHQQDSFAKVVLNKPKALNSLNLAMVRDINSQINYLDSLKAFWMEGAGGKSFCAGGDVKVLYDKDSTVEDRRTFFREQFSLDYKISQLKSLQIVNWDGIVMGGGFGISSFAPYRIATQNTMFAMPQAKLGFFTDIGSSYTLSKLRNNIGYYLGLTGGRLKGEDVYIAGLANYFIPRQDILKVYGQISSEIPKSKDAKQSVETILAKYHKPSGKKTIQNEESIKELFSKSSAKQIYQEVSSKQDKFHTQMKKMMDDQCPLSLDIIYKQITRSKGKSIKECFNVDYNICQHMIVDPNFAEGVRCVLVQKGAKPTWSHKHINDVKNEDSEKYFQNGKGFDMLNI